MRLWKKISIFFIYPACMLSVGFGLCLGVQKLSPPDGRQEAACGDGPWEEEPLQDEAPSANATNGVPSTNSVPLTNRVRRESAGKRKEALGTGEPSIQAVELPGQVVTADTRYVVKSFDLADASRRETVEPLPEQYIGMDRQALVSALDSYEKSPSLEDLGKGFVSVDVERFSEDEIVVRKNYESSEKCTQFYLAVENHYVVVYEADRKTKYMTTGIPLQSLSDELAREIMEFKFVGSEAELYTFLESYSS